MMHDTIEALFAVSNVNACVSAYGSPVHSMSFGLPSACSTRCQRRSALVALSSSIRFRFTSSSRVVCSARSRYRLIQYKLSATRESIGISFHWLSTQVSLLPPPCDEFTTSDPRFSATRVNPPGTIVTLSP